MPLGRWRWPANLLCGFYVLIALVLPSLRGERKVGPAVRWALDVVSMAAFADRRPSELSGGQQQREAPARAGRPQVLLFNESLSNLDARLRDRTRTEISRIQRELHVPALYVTHDQTQALSMSDRVVVMRAGHVMQQGRPDDTAQLLNAAGQGGDAGAVALLRSEAIRLEPAAGTVPAPEGNRLTGTVRGGAYLGAHIGQPLPDDVRTLAALAAAPPHPPRIG